VSQKFINISIGVELLNTPNDIIIEQTHIGIDKDRICSNVLNECVVKL